MIKPVWTRTDDLSSLVEIPISSRDIPGVRNILHLLGVPEVGKSGGHGYIIADGAVSVSGTRTACETAVKNILYHLNGPVFQTADTILAEEQKGALPEGMI